MYLVIIIILLVLGITDYAIKTRELRRLSNLLDYEHDGFEIMTSEYVKLKGSKIASQVFVSELSRRADEKSSYTLAELRRRLEEFSIKQGTKPPVAKQEVIGSLSEVWGRLYEEPEWN